MNNQIMEVTDSSLSRDKSINYTNDLDSQPDITFYTELACADTVDTLKMQVLETVKKLGFSDFFFAVPGNAKAGVITTLPTEIYTKHLVGSRIRNDLLVEHSRKSTSPVFLSTIVSFACSAPFDTEIFQLCCELHQTMEDGGFSDCYAIPNPTQIRDKNAIFIIADKNSSQEEFRIKISRCKAILHLLSEAITNIGIKSFPTFFFAGATENVATITAKPLRLLNILAKDNITLKVAAEKLCISLDTANKHIASAKNALGAQTQAAAIYRAIKLGILNVDHEQV